MQSLGNWEEKSREEQSQETCLYVESQICGPRILFSQMTSKIREYCSFIGGETVAGNAAVFTCFIPETSHRKRYEMMGKETACTAALQGRSW